MNPRQQGVAAVVAAAAIQLTLGVAYIWSVFQNGVAARVFNGNHAAANLAFSLLLAMLAIGSVVGGKLAVKHGTRRVVFAGGVVLSAGFLIASLANANIPWLLWLAYGVMGGLGMGFANTTTVACAQKWHPRRKGLVTGITVSAIGAGGVVFTPVVEKLIAAFGGVGVGEPAAFRALAVVFLAVCSLGSWFLKSPPEGWGIAETPAQKAAQTRDRAPGEVLRDPRFYLVMPTLMLACVSGLMMIGFAKPIAEAKGLAAIATLGVLAIAVSNSLGRLLWGAVSDKLGRVNTLLFLVSGTAALALCVNAAHGGWLFAALALAGLFYGGLFGVVAPLVSELFGSRHLAANYGLVLLGWGAGAILASQVAGYYKNIAQDDIRLMFPAFAIASCCAAAGIMMTLALKFMGKRGRAG